MIRNIFKGIFYFIAFVAVGALAAWLVFEILDFDKTGKVPLLAGRSVSEASELMNERKLFLKIEREESNEAVEEGHIISQSIEPGERIMIGTEVRVVVSKGTEIYTMPSFEGQPLEEAKLTLANLGIQINKITKIHSDSVGKNRIIAQRPLPGNIERNEVNFLVSLGPYDVSYKCPSFVNMTIDDVRMLAEKLEIKLIEKDSGSRVIFQKPEAGAVIKRGDAVEVTLGRGWGMWF